MAEKDPLHSLPPLRDIIKRYYLKPEKSLGQNFLLDLNVTDKIARFAGLLDDCTVVEIGPGPGGLTRSLLAAGARSVIAIEKDPRCVHALQEVLVPAAGGRLQVLEQDALKTDVYKTLTGRVKIVANLPYNVGTPLLLMWLDDITRYESLTLMFQKEVGERISAEPSSKAYGRLSVKAQWLCEVEHAFDLPPEVFSPPPKVHSSVIQLFPRDKPLALADPEVLEKVVAAAFGQRRKTLRAALKKITSSTEILLEAANIDGMRRAETLSIEEFCALARGFEGKEKE